LTATKNKVKFLESQLKIVYRQYCIELEGANVYRSLDWDEIFSNKQTICLEL